MMQPITVALRSTIVEIIWVFWNEAEARNTLTTASCEWGARFAWSLD